MSQKLIIGILGAVILAGGGVWYYQTNIAEKSDATGVKNSTRVEAEEESGGIFGAIKSGSESFGDILKGGAAQECRFSGTDPETKEYGEGTIFIDGESFRMEANTNADGVETEVNIITHEKVMYMWSSDDEEQAGIKLDLSMFEDMESEEKPESPIDWLKDPESNVKYECKGWSVRRDSFEPPKDVVFTDMFGAMGAMFGGMMEGGVEAGMNGDLEDQGDDWSY